MAGEKMNVDRPVENRIETYPHWPLERWMPDLPTGQIDRIYEHWSAHDYESVYPAYHFCVAKRGGELLVVQTHDVRENMRNVYEKPDQPYAAHTRGRNSFAIGMSIMAMEGAAPDNFGLYPLTEELVDGFCLAVAKVAAFYGVPVDADHIMSHAESALHDGYFGTQPEQRWDIARLEASAVPLEPSDALVIGDVLRSKIGAAMRR
jgi:hypothetical protein